MKLQCSKESIEKARKIVKDGGIIVFPTDTVYGIGCDPYNKNSVKKIYKLKKRRISKPLPILAFSKETVSKIAVIDDNSEKLIKKFWPGPLTIILDVKDGKLKESMNLSSKVAVRVPSNKWTLQLLRNCNMLIGTSANISGQKPFVNPKFCSKNLEYDLLLDGGTIHSQGESTIIEFKNNELVIHRKGVLSDSDILNIL